jgi:hypothetical protein
MDCSGNLNYSFVSPSRLNGDGATALRRLTPILPRRYFRTTQRP